MQRRRLGVNIDHIATLRQARRTMYPDPIAAAALAESAGADQITLHLREDRRHIQERDLRILRQTAQVPVNLEMAAVNDVLQLALDIKPNTVTLVPERREELTTEGGLDVVNHREHLKRYVQTLMDGDIEVSLFIDPDIEQIRAAHKLNVPIIELHTGKYCEARTHADERAELLRMTDAAKTAHKLGMQVACGH